MERPIIPPSVDTELAKTINGLADGASNTPIILKSAPTTSNKVLKEGQRGYFNGSMYEQINGVCYQHALTSV